MNDSQANVAEFTVSELSSALKRTVEDSYGYVRVRAEVSGYRGPHASGHCYFALKDDKAKIEAVIGPEAHPPSTDVERENLRFLEAHRTSIERVQKILRDPLNRPPNPS